MALVTNMRYEFWFQELWSLTISQEQKTRFEALFQVFGKWHTDSSLTTSLALRLNLPAPPSLIIFGKRWKTPRSRCYTTELFFLKLYHDYEVIQPLFKEGHTKIKHCPLFFMLLRKSFLMLSAFPLYEGIKRMGKLDLVICNALKSKNINVMYHTFE